MKRCPQCNRTYADDTLSFCLEDGGLLSAEFDEEQTVAFSKDYQVGQTDPNFGVRNSEPTVVLPSDGKVPSQTFDATSTETNVKSPHLIYASAGVLAVAIISSVIWFTTRKESSEKTGVSPASTPTIQSTRVTDKTPEAVSKPDNPQPFSVPFVKYSGASWDEYGPGVENTAEKTGENLWMRSIGYITYQASLPETKKSLVINVRLSSELSKRTSTSSIDSSDVTLVVNGQEQGMQNIVPDNLVGVEYQWIVPNNVLRTGNNDITFKVGDGKYKNGLVIYTPIRMTFR